MIYMCDSLFNICPRLKYIIHRYTYYRCMFSQECMCVCACFRVCMPCHVLTGAGFIGLITITTVVTIAAHTDSSSLSCGAAVRRTLETQTWTLGWLEGTWWACCGIRKTMSVTVNVKKNKPTHEPGIWVIYQWERWAETETDWSRRESKMMENKNNTD